MIITPYSSSLTRALLLGLCSNTHIQDLHLDLSSCELRSLGGQIIQEQIAPISCIGSLNLSENGLDALMLSLVPALATNRHLKHLSLGKNFAVKSR
ncbi:hypothetical protein FKM82_018663 [Ascaphus truei]